MSLTSLSTPEDQIDSLGGLLTTLWLRSRETSVTCGDSSETPLTPLEFRSALLLHTLYSVFGVTSSSRAVSLDLARHLNHHVTSVASRRPSAPI